MGDEGKTPVPAREKPPAAARATADELREQQAIAAAMLIGEQSRREERKQHIWLAKRLGFFIAAMSIFGLLILFAYSRIREDFRPTLGMLAIGGVGAVGIVAMYWAYTEQRRE